MKSVTRILNRKVFDHQRAGRVFLLGLLLICIASTSAFASVPGLDRVGDKLRDVNQGIIDDILPYLVVLGVLAFTALLGFGQRGAMPFGLKLVCAAVLAANAIAIGLYLKG